MRIILDKNTVSLSYCTPAFQQLQASSTPQPSATPMQLAPSPAASRIASAEPALQIVQLGGEHVEGAVAIEVTEDGDEKEKTMDSFRDDSFELLATDNDKTVNICKEYEVMSSGDFPYETWLRTLFFYRSVRERCL